MAEVCDISANIYPKCSKNRAKRCLLQITFVPGFIA
ncbi:hypothetical protein T07_9887 [Trichinella nelsoni]|uniref:Uncharacterized protein n=1 Tax=Trichinella nelsoni TaxID=6336 RepID=A0A0V0REH4_9BILA|nr:hypothetical protein T07_9887 [Trichinella nelsoni]